MTEQDFATLVAGPLRQKYGARAYPGEKLQRIFEAFRGRDAAFVEKLVASALGEYFAAPSLIDLEHLARKLAQAATGGAWPWCPYCGGDGLIELLSPQGQESKAACGKCPSGQDRQRTFAGGRIALADDLLRRPGWARSPRWKLRGNERPEPYPAPEGYPTRNYVDVETPPIDPQEEP